MNQHGHFWRSHRQYHDMLRAFSEMQASDNPLTREDMQTMMAQWPQRYGFMQVWIEKDTAHGHTSNSHDNTDK